MRGSPEQSESVRAGRGWRENIHTDRAGYGLYTNIYTNRYPNIYTQCGEGLYIGSGGVEIAPPGQVPTEHRGGCQKKI